MANLSKRQVQSLFKQWVNGRSKVDIERSLGVSNANGKYATRLFESRLGLDTRFGQYAPVS